MPSMLHFLAHALFTICCLVQMGSARLPEFYHSTSAISAELESLEETCPGLFVEREPIDSQHFIDVVSLSRSENPVSHFFLLAGEHARELITAESALHFLKVLCGEEPALRRKAEAALADTSFTVIVNGNPISRAKVENGDFCLRVNENAVDLNRNWKAHWSSRANTPETYPGKKPFSERETQIFRKAATKCKPDVFLSVHSGTLGMYMPWAYKAAEASENEKNMKRVMEALDDEFCQCPSGPAGERVGYRSPGTCLDFVFEFLQVPFAYAFEIYAPPSQRKELLQMWQLKKSFHDAFSDFSGEPRQRIRFLEKRQQVALQSDEEAASSSCFVQFNPTDEEDFRETLMNWSEAYLELSQAATEEIRRPKQQIGTF